MKVLWRELVPIPALSNPTTDLHCLAHSCSVFHWEERPTACRQQRLGIAGRGSGQLNDEVLQRQGPCLLHHINPILPPSLGRRQLMMSLQHNIVPYRRRQEHTAVERTPSHSPAPWRPELAADSRPSPEPCTGWTPEAAIVTLDKPRPPDSHRSLLRSSHCPICKVS